MIPVTFNGEPVYLLKYKANFTAGMSAFFSRVSDVESSAEGLEARMSLNNAIRTRLSFQLTLTQHDSVEFRVALQRLKNLRVLCPFWPGAHNYYTGGSLYIAVPGGEVYTAVPGGEVYVSGTGEAPRINAGIWLTFEPDWSAYEVHTSDAPAVMTPSLAAVRVPLLLGYFETPPDPAPYSDQLLKCDIKFKQSSPGGYSLQPINTAFSDGPSLSGRTPQVFPLRPNWVKQVTAGNASVQVQRTDLGFGGEVAEVYYPQDSKRAMQLGFSMVGWPQIAQLLSFFHKRAGMVESFWVTGALAECKLTAPSSSSSTTITVDNTAGLGDNIYIAFVVPGLQPTVRRVASVASGTSLVLDSAPGVFLPGQAAVVSLILARFKKGEIEVKFDTDMLAYAQIPFIETSEYSTPSGEAYGSTFGALPSKAFLYRFYRRYPASTVIDRFTSFEGDINASGEVFTSHKGHFEHGDIEDSLEIDRTRVKVRSRAFPGNPLLLLFPNTLEVPLELEILECSPDAANVAGAPRQLFIGQVATPNQTGPALSCQVTHKLSTFLENVPTMMVQGSCPYRLYSGPCGLAEADWKFTAVVVSYTPGSGQITIGTITRGLGVPSLSLGWFRYGKFFGGAGSSSWVRSIYESTAISGGNITLTLSLPLSVVLSAGDTVYLNPGCTGTVDECRDKFFNYPKNYGGAQFVPNGDPSFGEAPKTMGSGKK